MTALTSLLAALLTATGTLMPVAPAQVADPCGMLDDRRVVSCFSDPTTNAPWIFDSLAAIVDTARQGDTIEIMMYEWRTGDLPERLAHKVIEAYERGVDVRVILDESSEWHEPIDSLRAADVPLVVCDDYGDHQDNCLTIDEPDYYDPTSELPMNHTKLLLFDIDGERMVVGGSANLGNADYYTVWNDMVRIRDGRLHGYLSQWFERVWRDDWNGWDGDTARTGNGDPAVGQGDLAEQAYVYPRVEKDPIVETLTKATACGPDGRAWVAISLWNTDARTGILGELVRLDDAGCDVRVLLSGGVEQVWVDAIRERLSGTAADDSEVRRVCELHHKFVLLDVEYEATPHELVVTGSNVWGTGSLYYSTELNLRVDGAVDAYSAHYERLWNEIAVTTC